MVITVLSEETVRLLGSPTVITTPVDLIKELLDNAIDAKATSVEILVAPNLVDKIEVRDNGHGIAAEDYDSLGRPGHTSKITSFDEIPTLGGTTLGFRGQALANANTLGNVTLTTRTAEDLTAVLLKLRADVGGVDSTKRVSAPVGTSMSVTGLYGNMPVRVRYVTKEATKHVSRIKQMLQEYALAKPGIRLSFRSLGGNAKWSYSPRPQATVREAVIQVFGTELMSQCMIRTVCSSQIEGEIKATKNIEQMSIQAVLPSADGDLTKISKGAFFAVDSRPMTTATGTMKRLLKMFKSHFAKALDDTGGRDCPRDPFICVNIICSPGAYDPNVEPSKNQVLFASESRLTGLFERLCKEVYKTQHNPDAFETLERRRLSHCSQIQTPLASSDAPEEGTSLDLEASSAEPRHEPRSDHLNAAVVRATALDCGSQAMTIEQYFLRSPCQSPTRSSSPSFSRASHVGIVPARRQVRLTPGQEHPNESAITEADIIETNFHNIDLQTGVSSTTAVASDAICHESPEIVPDIETSRYLAISSDEEAEVLASRFRGQLGPRIRLQACERPTVLPNAWTLAKSSAPTQPILDGNVASEGDVHDTAHPLAQQVDQVAEDLFDDLPILQPYGGLPGALQPARPIEVASMHTVHQPQLPMIASANTPDYSQDTNPANRVMDQAQPRPRFNGRHPLPEPRSHYENTGGNVGPDGLVQTTISFAGSNLSHQSKPQQTQLRVNTLQSRPNPPYRKPWKGKNGEKGSKASRKSQKAQGQALNQGYDHQIDIVEHNQMSSLNHKHAARQETHALRRPDDDPPENSITSLPIPKEHDGNYFDMDSRKYLMRRQRSGADNQRKGRPMLKRAKSDMLPLERVPNNYETQRLILTLVFDTENLAEVQTIPSEDAVFGSGYCAKTKLGEDMGLEDAAEIEMRLRRLLDEWTEANLGQRIDVEINLCALVKGKTITA